MIKNKNVLKVTVIDLEKKVLHNCRMYIDLKGERCISHARNILLQSETSFYLPSSRKEVIEISQTPYIVTVIVTIATSVKKMSVVPSILPAGWTNQIRENNKHISASILKGKKR